MDLRSIASANLAAPTSSGGVTQILKMAQDADAQLAMKLIAATVEATAQLAESATLGQVIDVYA